MFTLVFTTVFITILSGMIGLVLMQQRVMDRTVASEKSLNIAEAGIDYYRWHLAHSLNDYADGTGQEGCNPCGPYHHSYSDPWGTVIGSYDITITPPAEGSDVVTITALGQLDDFPNQTRTVTAQFRRPSLVKYMVVANDNMRFGSDTDVYGEIHSNGGVRFDGTAHNVVSSARTTYTDPDGAGLCTSNPENPNECPGVWTAQADPNAVFLAGTDYPTAPVDFNGITADLSNLKTLALGNATKINSYLWVGDGIYLEASGKPGYLLQFKVVGPTTLLDIYRVKQTYADCSWSSGGLAYSAAKNSISSVYSSAVATNVTMPSNGIIFVEDNFWVQGSIANARVTVVAASFPETPSTNKNIYINNDITYAGDYETTKATTTLGLIAQNDITIGLYSEDDLAIDAALLAQQGRIGRLYYPSVCSSTSYKRNSITIRGAMATYNRYGFSWVCGGSWCSGYHYRNLLFNDTLRSAPPPYYPVAGEYTFLNWKEVQ